MVDILFTFRDCNFYNFMFFFSSRKDLLLHLRIYSSVLLLLIIQETSSTAVQTCIPKLLIHAICRCIMWFSAFFV